MSTGGFVCQDEGSGCAAQFRLRDNAESLPRGFRLLQALRTASRTQRVLRRRSRWSSLNDFEAVECCYRRTSLRGRPILAKDDDVRGLNLSHGIRTLQQNVVKAAACTLVGKDVGGMASQRETDAGANQLHSVVDSRQMLEQDRLPVTATLEAVAGLEGSTA